MIKDKFMAQINPKMVQTATFPNEPQWMTDFRKAAFQRMQQQQLPKVDKVDYHTWPFNHTKTAPILKSLDIPKKIKKEAERYQFVTFQKSNYKNEVSAEMQQHHVICCSIADAMHNYTELIKPYLTNAERMQANRLSCLQIAMMNSGCFIYVPKQVTLKHPINIMSVVDDQQAESLFHRTIIVSAAHSRFNVVQRVLNVGSQRNVAHLNVDIYAQSESHVQYFALDSLSKNNTVYLTRHAYVGNDARVDWMIGSLNDGNVIANFTSYLKENGSKSENRVVSILNRRQQQGINTKIINYRKHSTGKIDQRGAILDRARLVFNGVGKVVHGAHGANNQQENHVLILSDHASGDANPILLIDENDVDAGHAASVGKIDERQLYYLTSRGFKK